MSAVTAEMIKELRLRTGVGMAKCKEALEQAGGNIEQAIESLRKSGIASAVKKEGRETKEGLVVSHDSAESLVLFELSAETDFVVNNEHFQSFARNLVKQIAVEKPADLNALMNARYSAEPQFTVEEKRALIVQAIGENIQPKRYEIISKQADTTYGLYSHMGGKIVTVVILEGSAQESELAHDLAMHVCASSPEYLDPSAVSAEVIEKEREIAKSQVQNKPANIIDSIVEGKLKAYYKEVCFLQQPFFKETKLSVEQVIEAQSKKIAHPLKVSRYLRWSVK